jgi:serine/threonine-protein kinase
MATVHYGRLSGPVGFSRTVAIKRLHPQFAKDPEFVSMFLDEARLAARIRHPNVVQTLDVVALEGELFLVMDYVQGESLSRLLHASQKRGELLPMDVVSAIVCGVLHGLHAAHEATTEQGEPLGLVHRDVSPHNVLVGADGIPRVLDFGVAKAVGGVHTTRQGQLKGKLAYMAPEQLRSGSVDRRTDVFAAGIVLWEALTLRRLFAGDSEGAVMRNVVEQIIEAPSAFFSDLPRALDGVVMRALERDRSRRFNTARQMALALEACVPLASPTRVADWVDGLAGEVLAQRAQSVSRIEADSNSGLLPPRGRTGDATPPGGRSAEDEPGEATTSVRTIEASQVSSISVSSSGSHRAVDPGRRRRLAYVACGAAATATMIVLGAFAALRSRSSAPAEPALQATTPVLPSAVESTPAVSADEPPAPSAPSATVPTVVAAPPKVPQVTTPAQAPPPKPCTIRSYVDTDGIKHFVKECK